MCRVVVTDVGHSDGKCRAVRSWRSQSSASDTMETVKNPVFFGMLTLF
ncbi:hypothetical protein HMPREF3231_01199 [Bifidobacterium longum]|nr:hypothetical protein HMPREF3231_01199 [Bifidobacterium longum]